GYDAAYKDEKLFVRKACDRKEPGMYHGGYRGYWVMYALARMWTEQAARPEWLRAGIAHLIVYHALQDCPTIYDARAFRDEVLVEGKKNTDTTPLEQWTPAPPASGVASAENPVPVPQVGRAFGFLY